jgi:hypothetical protein
VAVTDVLASSPAAVRQLLGAHLADTTLTQVRAGRIPVQRAVRLVLDLYDGHHAVEDCGACRKANPG